MTSRLLPDAVQRRTLVSIAYAGIVLGAVLTMVPFVTGTSTLAACDFGGGFFAGVYELV